MDRAEFAAALERYPELKAGLPDHVDELLRIVERIIEMEKHPPQVPDLPPEAPKWERAYWRRRVARDGSTA